MGNICEIELQPQHENKVGQMEDFDIKMRNKKEFFIYFNPNCQNCDFKISSLKQGEITLET